MTIDIARQRIEERAREFGCATAPWLREYEYEYHHRVQQLRSRLIVNGHKCLILSPKCMSDTRTKGSYTSITCSGLRQVGAVIFYLAVPGYDERFYVVPSFPLLYAFFSDRTERISARILVPLEQPRCLGISIDLYAYRDAWHLLGVKAKAA